jgi:hypothetical protein
VAARFAGQDAGTVVVSIEFPNRAAFCKDDTKTHASADYQNWLKGRDKIRKITFDSLYCEW